MAEHGISTSIAAAAPTGSRGWLGWLAGWLQDLAEAEQAALRRREDADGQPFDEREEDLRFAAFMTGPLY